MRPATTTKTTAATPQPKAWWGRACSREARWRPRKYAAPIARARLAFRAIGEVHVGPVPSASRATARATPTPLAHASGPLSLQRNCGSDRTVTARAANASPIAMSRLAKAAAGGVIQTAALTSVGRSRPSLRRPRLPTIHGTAAQQASVMVSGNATLLVVWNVGVDQGSASEAATKGAMSTCRTSRPTSRPRSEEHTLNSSHGYTSYAVFCLKKKNNTAPVETRADT